MPSESSIQINLLNWFEYNRPDVFPFLFHFANERSSSPQHGRKLKRMGVQAGVADLFLAIPNKLFHGMWIELKSDNGKLSDAQQTFLAKMGMMDYSTYVTNSWESARDAILYYLSQ